MTVTLHLDDAIAEALAAEAARRGQTPDQLAADLPAAQLPPAPRRRLAFAAGGASTSGRGAAGADEMLGEGFGRDQVLIVDTGPLVATADRADKDHAAWSASMQAMARDPLPVAEGPPEAERGVPVVDCQDGRLVGRVPVYEKLAREGQRRATAFARAGEWPDVGSHFLGAQLPQD